MFDEEELAYLSEILGHINYDDDDTKIHWAVRNKISQMLEEGLDVKSEV